MNYTKFALSFWHPFGPHAGETMDEIVARKCREINANGWTLWSFAYRRMLGAWSAELAGVETVFAFCSEGKNAVDPNDEATECGSYQLVGESAWRPMPSAIRVTNPGRDLASAFVVKRISGGPVAPINVEWLSKDGAWRATSVPTRGVYLIRPGGTVAMRRVAIVLELKPPYLAIVSADSAK
jgi:hypothetical protein